MTSSLLRSNEAESVRDPLAGEALHIVTASQDQSVNIYRLHPAPGQGRGTEKITDTDTDGTTSHQHQTDNSFASLEEVKRIPYLSPVQDVLLMMDGVTIVIALKGSNYLRLLDLRRMKVRDDKRKSFLAAVNFAAK